MIVRHLELGVVVARTRSRTPWLGEAWRPHSVLSSVPEATPGTRLVANGDVELVYAGSRDLILEPGATGFYRDNLTARQPSLWLALQLNPKGGYCLGRLTADPYEGEALTEGLDVVVDAVPMPAGIRAVIADFVAAFHVERPFVKRRRDALRRVTTREQLR